MVKKTKADDYPSPEGADVAPIERLPQVTSFLSKAFDAALKWVTRSPRGAKDVYATYIALRRLKDVVDGFAKKIDEQKSLLEAKYVAPTMEETLEASSITLKEAGVRLQLRYDTFTSIRSSAEDGTRLDEAAKVAVRERAYTWLHKNKMGGIIQPYVQPQTLAANMRAWMDETHKEPPKELFSVFNRPIISMVNLGKKD